MRPRLSLPLILCIVFLIFPSFGSGASVREGVTLLKKAVKLQKTARSNEDLEAAVRLYEKALAIFRQAGAKKGQGVAYNNLGSIYKGWGKYDKALEFYRKAVAVRKAANDVKGMANTLSNLGRLALAQGQYDAALDSFRTSLSVRKKLGDRKGEGRELLSIGNVYLHRSDYDKAREYYEKSLEACKEAGDRSCRATNLNNLGSICTNQGEYAKAEKLLDESLAIKRALGDRRGEAQTLLTKGNTYFVLGDYDKAEKLYRQSLAVREALKEKRGIAHALTNLGNVCWSRGSFDCAVEYYNRSIRIYRKLNDRKAEGATCNNLAAVYSAWGRYDKASDLYKKSLAIRKSLGDRKGEAVSLANLGNVYRAWGIYSRALEMMSKSLAIRRSLRDRKGTAHILILMGSILAHRGRYDQALAVYNEALNLEREIGLPTLRPERRIANLYLDRGDTERAGPMILDLVRRYGEQSHKPGLWASAGRLHLARSDYQKAKESYQRLLDDAEKSGSAGYLFTAFTGLGRVCEAQGELRKAENFYQRAVKLTEEIRSRLMPSERRNFFDVRIEGFARSEPAKGLTRVRIKLNRGAESLESSELTKARAFCDALSMKTGSGHFRVPGNILEKDKQLLVRVASLKRALAEAHAKNDTQRIAGLTSQMGKALQAQASFVEMLWTKYPYYASVKHPRPTRLEKAAIGPEEYIVVLDDLGEGVGVKLLKGTQILEADYRQWNSEDRERAVRKFRASFERARLMQFDAVLAAALYDRLLAKVLLQVPKGSPIVIIPDGILALIPFEALVTRGTARWKVRGPFPSPEGLTYLADVHPVSYYQSITALSLLRTSSRGEKVVDRTLVFADPVFSPDDKRCTADSHSSVGGNLSDKENLLGFPDRPVGLIFERLPLTGKLGESLKKLDPQGTDLFMGMKATKATLFQRLREPYRYVVLATHGYYGNDIPMIQEPVLALTFVGPFGARGGFLGMTEVMGMNLHADLAALTACQTGLGRILRGEGIMSMGRAFQYAGARAVLMSLWSVAERSSVSLVERFFGHLRKGKSGLEALRLAREEIRRAGYDHPFFWAPFILVGEVN